MKKILSSLCLLFLTACGPTEGTVVDKQFYPDHTDLIPMYYSCGNGCSSFSIVPVYTPPCWEVFLRKGDETGDHCIDQQAWNTLTLGQYYKIPD